MKYKMFGFSFLVFVLFVIDRVFKFIYFRNPSADEVFIFGDFVKLKLALNSGIAFGLSVNYYLLIVLYVLILLGLAWFLIQMHKKKNLWQVFFILLIIAGAFSNLLDRIYLKEVIDYIDVKYYSVFNIADVMIVLGVIGLFFKGLKK